MFACLYVLYSLMFTCSLVFGVLYAAHRAVWSGVSSPHNLGRELQKHVNQSLGEIRAFEERERRRIFDNFQVRILSCVTSCFC